MPVDCQHDRRKAYVLAGLITFVVLDANRFVSFYYRVSKRDEFNKKYFKTPAN